MNKLVQQLSAHALAVLDDCDAQTDDGAQIEPADWDLAAQPASYYQVDQRINW